MENILTIVIPVYNVEKYLDRCISSVAAQSSDCWEAILVDDGSTDDSGLICDSWAKKNSRIRTIHQANRGLSAARNAGIDLARGDYIMLLDSDDYLTEDAVKHISEYLGQHKPDVLYGKAWTVDDSGVIKEKVSYHIDKQIFTGTEYLNQLKKSSGGITFCAQFGVYSKVFLNLNNLRFCEGLIHEDELWTPYVILNARRIFLMDEFFYFHYIRSGSIMHSGNNEKSAINTIEVCERLKELYDSYPQEEILYLRDRLAMLYLRAIPYLPLRGKAIRRFGRVFPLKYAWSVKNRVKAFAFFLSPEAYCLLSKMIRKQ